MEAHAGPTDELSDRKGGGGRGAAVESAEEARGGAWCGGRDGGGAWVPVDTNPDLEIVDDEHSWLERGHDFRTVSRGGAERFLVGLPRRRQRLGPPALDLTADGPLSGRRTAGWRNHG
jgi:hypothetical protein